MVWALLLLLLAAFAWVNHNGLPEFLKTRLVAALRQRGVELEFTRMRLHYYHGLVCDNVRVGAADDAAGPVLTAREVQLRISYSALLHGHLQMDGLVLRQGKFTLPLTPQDSLLLTNLQGELRILPQDTWVLDHFRVDLAGVTFTLAGQIAHAPECRHWQLFGTAPAHAHAPGPGQASLKKFADTLKQIHFEGQPRLDARIDGDARAMHSFNLSVSARAPAIQTPWFNLRHFEFATHLLAPTNTLLQGGPAWDVWTNLEPFRLDWFARGTNFQSGSLQADALDCTGVWGETRDLHSLALTFNARAHGVQSPWGNVRSVDLVARAAPVTNVLAADPAWSYWTNLAPFRLDWLARGTDLECDRLQADTLACRGNWNAPELTVSELSAHLAGGALETGTKLNVATRALDFNLKSTFDLHALAPFLSFPARLTLAQFSWSEPPRLDADGTLTLPAWTNSAPAWLDELAAGAQVRGGASMTNLHVARLPGVNGLSVDSLQLRFAASNQVWNLPRLALRQDGTALELSGELNALTEQFHGRVAGRLEAASLHPFLLDSNAVRVFHKYLAFHAPVALALEAGGSLLDFSTLTATGRVDATRFAIRNQEVDRLTATFSYSNLTAEFFHPEMTRAGGAETFTAEGLTLDLAGEKLLLHHGRGHVSPVAVAKAIGPKTAEAMEPYHFLAIPEAMVDGCIPLKQRGDDLVTDDADLRFDVVGSVPFRWRRFETPRITGTIRWLANHLILTNMASECYGGTARGWGVFNLETPGDGTDFSFFVAGTNVDFHAMSQALWSPTNALRGALSGSVLVTRANSSDWRTWNGYGDTQLQNGLLWDAPIFGRMSPVLNTLMPGLDIGNSRATDAAGRFTLTNGVIYTDTLVIHSGSMRLEYFGTVDLDENVAARARAQLFRNTPVFGQLFSTVLRPVSEAFECDVTGTLDTPRIKLAYIPFTGLLAVPLHPIRTVEKIFAAPTTNAPAAKP